MSRIRASGTKIEKLMGTALWSIGLRYRKNYRKLLGKPDFVLIKYKIAVFCDSEFWHGYDWDNRKCEIKSNKDFWIKKIEQNIQRDNFVNRKLKSMGWQVFRYWGKDIISNPLKCANLIKEYIKENEYKYKTWNNKNN